MKILIVEDNLSLSDVISFTLRRAGFEVSAVYDGLAAIDTWEKEQPDLLILDLNLPGRDGLSVCRHIRTFSQTPIIILSVRSDDEDVVAGLELGADDYVVKPFSPNQLVARVRAVMRRTGVTPTAGPLEVGPLSLDRTRNEVRYQDRPPVRLTPLEARLLEQLMLNVGQVVPADTLIDAVWGIDGGDRTMLKQLIYRLRGKIEPDPTQPAHIETIPGIGYALTANPI
jgi:DNA-binding response OmpR family regulator